MNIINKMSMQIIQMKSMVAREEFHLKDKRKEGEGILGCVNSEGDVKNQDKVG
jgi:hypothetical protein